MSLKTYEIVPVSPSSGLIEFVEDSVSIAEIRRTNKDLLAYFTQTFGPPGSKSFLEAQRRFYESLAGWCLASYVLQLKDRHNANILVTKEGALVHIDFGFVLGIAPGSKTIQIEKVPFKLTSEWLQVLGGGKSSAFHRFSILMAKGLRALNQESEKLILLA